MKVRQIKQMHYAMALATFHSRIVLELPGWVSEDGETFRLIDRRPDPKIEELLTSMGMGSTSAQPAEPAVAIPEAKTYTVSRKKDGVVVGEYQTLDEAEAAIAAAKRQKKAALELQPT